MNTQPNVTRFSKRRQKQSAALSVAALALSAPFLLGQTAYVNEFGAAGFESDDTRTSDGTNIVNDSTNAPAPGAINSPEGVSSQIEWLNLNGTRGNLGGVSLDGTTTSAGKSTISIVAPEESFGSTSWALGSNFHANWQWIQTGSSSQGAALKFGIQSNAWEQSQVGFTATRSGEAAWDLILVAGTSGSGTNLSTADFSNTVWTVFQQAGNTYFSSAGPVATGTLEQILNGEAEMSENAKFTAEQFADMVFGENAYVTSTQLGIGSGQANGKPVVDYLQVSFLNDGDKMDFVDASLWKNAAGGELSESSNWDGPVVSPTQNGVFGLDEDYIVTVSANTAVRSLGVGAGNVELTVGPGVTLDLQNDGYLSAEVDSSLNVTGGAGSLVTAAAIEAWGNVGVATNMILDGGSVNHPVRAGRYALVVGEGGTFDLNEGANLTVVNETGAAGVKTLIRVGEGTPEGGIATMNIKEGSYLNAGSLHGSNSWTGLHVGDFGATGVVNQTGGTVDLFGGLVLGNQGGAGTYNISGSTSVLNIFRPVSDNGAIILGRATNNQNSEGFLNVSGGLIVLGAEGGAGGNVSLVLGGLSDNVPAYASGKGTVTQTGGEVRFQNGALKFGRGQGTYNLDGGILSIGGANGISATPNGNYAFNFGGGTLRVINSNLTTSINASLAKGVSVIDTNGRDATWSGALTGSGTLHKAGQGALYLSGNNDITGHVYVVGGTLAQTGGDSKMQYLAVGSGGGTDGVFEMSGGSLFSSQAIQVGDWGGAGELNQTGGSITVGTEAIGASFNVGNQGGAGVYNLSGGSFTILGGFANLGRSTQATAGNGTLNLSGSGTFTIGAGGDLIVGDRDPTGAEGAGSVHQTGGVLRVLSGGELWVGSYGAGTYNLDGGVLEVGGASLKSNYGSSEGGYALNLGNGTLRVSGSNLTSSLNATLVTSSTWTLDTNGLNATWSGQLSGDGSMRKTGTGSLTLSGSNSFTGALQVQQGKITATHAHALGKGDVLVSNGSTLEVGDGILLNLGAESSVVLAADGVSAFVKNYGNGEHFANFGSAMSGSSNLTVAELRNGNASSSEVAVTATFSMNSTATNDEIRVSDVLSLNGLDGETFVLQLSYSAAIVDDTLLRLGWFNGTEWENAADGTYYEGAYGVVYSGLDVGAYGIDTTNNVVWAVLNHNSDFAVIPEPSACVLLGMSLATVLFGRRRNPRT